MDRDRDDGRRPRGRDTARTSRVTAAARRRPGGVAALRFPARVQRRAPRR